LQLFGRVEASYHFANFFGVVVGLEYGDTWRQTCWPSCGSPI